MPAQVMASLDSRIFAEWKERFAELNLSKSELVRYSIAISCGYSEENALLLAKLKPSTSERISSKLISQNI